MAGDDKNQFKFIWKIKNSLSCSLEDQNIISSPVFVVEFLTAPEWNLDFWPNRNDEKYKYAECYLTRKRPDQIPQTVLLSYKIEFLDLRGGILRSNGPVNQEFKKGSSFGWNMIESVQLFEEMKAWTEDTLTIRCTITSLESTDKPQITECEALTVLDVDSRVFKWNLLNFGLLETAEKIVLSFLDNTSDFKISISAPKEDMVIKIRMLHEKLLKKLNRIKLTFLSDLCGEIVSKCDVHTFETTEEWQFPTFASKEDFKLAIAKQNFTFVCEFASSKRGIASSSIERYTHYLVFNDDSNPEQKSHIPLMEDFQKLYINMKFSDVKLRAENEEFLAHKAVLAVRSPVFSAMFDQEMLETQTGLVDIQDMDKKTLQNLIEYIYTDVMNFMDCRSTLKLLLAADKYQVQTLVEKCSSLVLNYLNVDNACEIITVADMINHECLKSLVLNFIFINASEVLETPNWSSLIENNVKLASDILSKLSKYLKGEKTT